MFNEFTIHIIMHTIICTRFIQAYIVPVDVTDIPSFFFFFPLNFILVCSSSVCFVCSGALAYLPLHCVCAVSDREYLTPCWSLAYLPDQEMSIEILHYFYTKLSQILLKIKNKNKSNCRNSLSRNSLSSKQEFLLFLHRYLPSASSTRQTSRNEGKGAECRCLWFFLEEEYDLWQVLFDNTFLEQ